MRKDLLIAWMDALIETWYKMRMLRTLAEPGGGEYCTCLNFYYEMQFHLNSSGCDRKRIDELAAAVGAEMEVKDFDEKTDEISFYYKGFKFFALDGKE